MARVIGKGILRIGNEEKEIDVVEIEIDISKVKGVGIDKLLGNRKQE